ncbi:hypothetical protein [Streptomyces sp. NPDC060184]|uniref:hypothetical protein n=1 Tax=Streptomyces sp. NPDC060184 TaxID=3347064 RepID=UPI003656C6E0
MSETPGRLTGRGRTGGPLPRRAGTATGPDSATERATCTRPSAAARPRRGDGTTYGGGTPCAG